MLFTNLTVTEGCVSVLCFAVGFQILGSLLGRMDKSQMKGEYSRAKGCNREVCNLNL